MFCKYCLLDKPFEAFHKVSKNNPAPRSICKQCQSLQAKKLYSEDSGFRRRQIMRNYRSYRINRQKIIWRMARLRADKLGIPFSIRPEDIDLPTVCPVLGIVLSYDNKQGAEDSPSLDRVVPERGYVPGNVNVISGRANRIKSDASLSELKKLIDYIESNS